MARGAWDKFSPLEALQADSGASRLPAGPAAVIAIGIRLASATAPSAALLQVSISCLQGCRDLLRLVTPQIAFPCRLDHTSAVRAHTRPQASETDNCLVPKRVGVRLRPDSVGCSDSGPLAAVRSDSQPY